MSEQTLDKMQSPEQLSEILLVLDKEKMKIMAVKGIDEKGNLETVEPTKKNQNQFMKIDKQGDLFSNFFSNFFSQLKNPTNFSFFKTPELLAIDTAKEMQKQIDQPTAEGEQLMKQHEVKAEGKHDHKQENKNNMETPQTPPETNEYKYKPEQIDWETMNNLGLSKEKLEKMNLLDPLLKGYKTNELVPVSLNLGTAVTRMDARLSLQHNDDGQVVVAIHGIRKEPNLNYAFFGHQFTKEDKDNLLQTGNMGRVVNLTNPKTNETISSIVSVDRLTNELVALRTDFIKIPEEIKGVKLNEEQKQTLQDGKPLYIEGMVSKKGAAFDATIQYNADKRFVEFLFDRGTNKQTQGNEQNQFQEAPKIFRDKELDKDQYQKFKDGQTIYVSGLVDKKGKEYNGYITFNKEIHKTDFSFQNPDKIKEQAKPTEAYKTQTAVNSEGKTNEATKNSKEPLKSGQENPDSKKQQQEQEAYQEPAKSKGRKM
ncbi:DUF3945 domain-containing protein [Flavobacterium sp. NPDC079362]|uniref:DUF3945 domain-containing protein n=1 Tax=Flavobacterium sp. NPDC079362 TaxID=3390566 RepID=UPI003CFD8FF7